MKTTIDTIAALAVSLLLPSCGIPIPDNDFVEGEVGFYKRATPFDPAGKLGVFFSKPKTEINPEK